MTVPRVSEEDRGKVWWVTGLSGAGKTTVATLLVQELRSRGQTVFMQDGDLMRAVLGDAYAHTPEDRRKLAQIYGRLAKEMTDQGVHVVCATISMFDDVRAWNREAIAKYCEVYLRVPMEALCERDTRGLYRDVREGRIQGVMGADLAFEAPKNPDIVIDNFGDMTPEQAVAIILSAGGV